MVIIEEKVEKLEVQAKAHQILIEELNTMLFLVASASDGYFGIRNRFFVVLRLDLFNQNSAGDHQWRSISYTGDVLDALLFGENIRNDISTFQLLYGFTPQMVMKKLSMFF